MAYLSLFYLCGLTLDLRPREVINPFPDLSNFTFDSEDAILILSSLSNFNDMSKVTYLSPPLISFCFLTLRRPQFSCSHLRTWKFVVVAMLVNIGISRVVASMSPWTYHWNLTVWKRLKSHLHSQKKNWKDHERSWLPLCFSRPR